MSLRTDVEAIDTHAVAIQLQHEAVMENEHWEHRRPGIEQAVCAWAIVLVVAMLFTIANLIWPKEPALFNFGKSKWSRPMTLSRRLRWSIGSAGHLGRSQERANPCGCRVWIDEGRD